MLHGLNGIHYNGKKAIMADISNAMSARLRMKQIENIESWNLTVGNVAEYSRLQNEIKK